MLIIGFTERFEVNVREGKFSEEDLRELESSRINVLNLLVKNHNLKSLKANIYRIWNICKMLNYTRNIKDVDNNFFILRLKDICCDFLSYTLTINSQDININDIFNMMLYTTETSRIWSKQNLDLTYEGWLKKVDFIMKFLQLKVNELEILLNLEQKFYLIFMDFSIFKLENMIKICDEKKIIINENDKLKFLDQIIQILFLLKNVKFIENDNNYLNIFFNHLLNFLKINENDLTLKESIFKLFDCVHNIKYKSLISNEIILDFNRLYINILIESHQFKKADGIMNELFENVSLNTKEELSLYIIQIEILLNNTDLIKAKEVLEIIFEHKEFCLEGITEILILCSNTNK